MAFAAKISSGCFRHLNLEGCLLKKALQRGFRGTLSKYPHPPAPQVGLWYCRRKFSEWTLKGHLYSLHQQLTLWQSWQRIFIYLFFNRLELGSTCGCSLYVAWYTTSLFRNITRNRPYFAREKDSHNIGNFTPYSLRTVCRFFNVPRWNILNIEGIVRRGVRFIVLIQEDLKV